jgi:hypothetical protein
MDNLSFKDVQLWALSEATSDELDLLQEAIRIRRSNMFRVDQRVWFDAKTRGVIHGKITKIKQKNVQVLADNGVQWTVSPMVLHHEKAVTPTSAG